MSAADRSPTNGSRAGAGTPARASERRRVEARLDYAFDDPTLLDLALTHSSAGNEHNQRLEFLGDAVVGLAMAKHLYERFPGRPEGDLTRIRAVVVSAAALERALHGLELEGAIEVGPSLARRRFPSSLAANVFEAVVGAVYLDGGFAPAAELVVRCLAAEVAAVDGGKDRNWKSILQQITQREDGRTPTYPAVGRHGPAHHPWFEVEARLDDDALGRGVGSSKKAAAQAAAKAATARLLGPGIRGVQEGAIPRLAAPLQELLATRPLAPATSEAEAEAEANAGGPPPTDAPTTDPPASTDATDATDAVRRG